MHPQAAEGFRRMLTAIHSPHRTATLRVVDIGGADVNGTIHQEIKKLFPVSEIIAVDIAPGDGVDHVVDFTDGKAVSEFMASSGIVGYPINLVVCTEVLEHVKDWRGLLLNAVRLINADGGAMVGTCASTGRRPHGARGARWPAPGEHYANIDPTELTDWLTHITGHSGANDRIIRVVYMFDSRNATTCDLYWSVQLL